MGFVLVMGSVLAWASELDLDTVLAMDSVLEKCSEVALNSVLAIDTFLDKLLLAYLYGTRFRQCPILWHQTVP